MKEEYVAPERGLSAFNCPHCQAYAHQEFSELGYLRGFRGVVVGQGGQGGPIFGYLKEKSQVSICAKCKRSAFWIDDIMVYPMSSNAPLPTEDMPKDVKEDFREARNIVNASPRAAAAVLRLALQKLMPFLDEKGKNLNEAIGNLVKKGLPKEIQESLDSIRVIGNNAVHPGQIDLKDDAPTAIALFELLNWIVEDRITRPRKIKEMYGKIPKSVKDAIEKRDKEEI